MRIAVVSQDWMKGSCNGTQTSAVAFAHHAMMLGHDVTLVALTKSGSPSINFIVPGCKLNTYSVYEDQRVLNGFDSVFFSSVGQRPNRNTVELLEVAGLHRPFAIMAHGEGDHRAYRYGIQEIANHPHCRGVAVVSQEAANDLDLKLPRMVFYPCTLPSYNLQGKHQWARSEETRGLVYAARLVNYKTPQVLAQLTCNDDFLEACDGEVAVYGVPAGRSGAQLEGKCNAYNPRWTRYNGTQPVGYYDVYNWKLITSMYKSRRFYWDVFRVKGVNNYFRRWNLGAMEAARFGVIPVVNPRMAPEWTHDFSVLVDPESWTADAVAHQMQTVNDNLDHYRSLMRERLLDGPYSFASVQRQVRDILSVLS